MKTIGLKKRVIIYLIDIIIYSSFGFLCTCPFIFYIKLHVAFNILICCGFIFLLSFLSNYLLRLLSKGYTIVSLLFFAKVVGVEEKRITKKQAFLRSINEALFIYLLFDLIYLVKNKTERGFIDRLSDTFYIDMRY